MLFSIVKNLIIVVVLISICSVHVYANDRGIRWTERLSKDPTGQEVTNVAHMSITPELLNQMINESGGYADIISLVRDDGFNKGVYIETKEGETFIVGFSSQEIGNTFLLSILGSEVVVKLSKDGNLTVVNGGKSTNANGVMENALPPNACALFENIFLAMCAIENVVTKDPNFNREQCLLDHMNECLGISEPCNDISGTWNEDTLFFDGAILSLSQNGTSVTGSMIEPNLPDCSWSVSGTYNSDNRNMTLTGSPNSSITADGIFLCCAFRMTGIIDEDCEEYDATITTSPPPLNDPSICSGSCCIGSFKIEFEK